MSVLCVINTKLIWDNDIGYLLNGREWNEILLSRSLFFPCLPPVGTQLFLECECFNDLVVEGICYFEKSDRVNETTAFYLECNDQDMGTLAGVGSGQELVKDLQKYLKDGWFLGEFTDSNQVIGRWKQYVDEQEKIRINRE